MKRKLRAYLIRHLEKKRRQRLRGIPTTLTLLKRKVLQGLLLLKQQQRWLLERLSK